MQLIFSNKPSHLNKKLIKFFKINLLNLNKASMIFDFEVANPEDIDKYVSMGIKNYPVLIHKNTSVTGVEKIITYLKQIVQKHNNRILNKTESEKLDDFWKHTLGKVEVDESGKLKPDDDDEDDDAGADLQHKIQKAFEARNNSTATTPASLNKGRSRGQTQLTRNNNLDESPSQTLKNMKSKGLGSMDDELMAKFFENQEETK